MAKTEGVPEFKHDQLEAATEIAVRAGALTKCGYHNYEFLGKASLGQAISLGNQLFDQKDTIVSHFATREELITAITYTVENTLDSCQAC